MLQSKNIPMLQSKNIILRCIFLLTFSRVNAFLVLQFKDLDEKDLVSNVMDAVDKRTVRNAGKNVMNNVAVRGMELKDYLGSRKSGKSRKFLNKKLVKRIVPHGYEVNNLEVDDKFKTIYKPLVRIHKQKPISDAANNGRDENKYDLMLVLDGNEYNDVANMKNDDLLLKPFASDNMDIKYLPIDEDIKDDKTRVEKNYDSNKLSRFEMLDKIAHKNDKHLIKVKYRDVGSHRDETNDIIPLNLKSFKSFSDHKDLLKHVKRENELVDGWNSKDISDKLLWFGTVGQLISKHKDRTQQQTDTENSNSERYNKDVKRSTNTDNYIHLVKKIIEMQKNNRESPMQIENLSEVKNHKFTPDKYGLSLVGGTASFGKLSKRSHYIDQYYEVLKKLIEISEKYNHEPIPIKRQNEVMNKVAQLIADKQLEPVRWEPKVKQRKEKQTQTDFQTANEYNLLSQLAQLKADKLFGPVKERTDRNFDDFQTSNKYNLLNQMSQSKADKPFGLVRGSKNRKDRSFDDLETSNKNLLSQLAQLKADKLFRPLHDKDKQKKESKIDHRKRTKIYNLLGQLFKNQKEKKTRMLRANEKSGEEEGWKPKFSWDQPEEVTTAAPKSVMAHYPFWNYWTYGKTIHQDKCKGSLIQVGDLCIRHE